MSIQENPYAAPAAMENTFAPLNLHSPVVPAGKGARFANYLIDYVVQIALSFMLGMVIVIVAGEQGAAFLDGTPGIILGIPILVGYYFVFEVTTSRTLGKLITGTKVVTRDGEVPTAGQILGRSFCRLIPFEVISFIGTPTIGWHDSIPKTMVVKAR